MQNELSFRQKIFRDFCNVSKLLFSTISKLSKLIQRDGPSQDGLI